MSALASTAVTIVMIHGAFADGTGWRPVYEILKKDGYEVTIVQNSTISLGDDVAATQRAIDAAPGQVLLVGHSYGGSVITQAGNDPKVVGLVYVAAFMPDKGESVASLTANPPPGSPPAPIVPTKDGYLVIDRAKFHAAFAADVDAKTAAFMADSQPAWGPTAVGGVVTDAAWKNKPSFYLLATEDHMIPPAAQKQMATRAGAKITEVKGSHAIFLSQPAATAAVIVKAAKEVAKPKP
jgi:pimeloyl-ACP methyl ester carboxylesterase